MTEENRSRAPWYAPTDQKNESAVAERIAGMVKKYVEKSPREGKRVSSMAVLMFGLVLFVVSGALLALAFWPGQLLIVRLLAVAASIAFFLFGLLRTLKAVGRAVARSLDKPKTDSRVTLALEFMRGTLGVQETRRGVPAPELALQQFVQQVRAYSVELSYQRGKENRQVGEQRHASADTTDLMRRRWNEVIDSLNEFEIYLANDPKAMIEKLVSKSPSQNIDVSQIFREVAETFDTTWRRKGINIESAIVTPLRATTNEAVLRRVLVGPWRASAYFARRGSGVVFAAKSVNGKVVASWECNGLVIPDAYLDVAQDASLTVNERIERGMSMLCTDPSSPNTFHALVSFVTWIDLAKTANVNYRFKHANDGFVIEIRLD